MILVEPCRFTINGVNEDTTDSNRLRPLYLLMVYAKARRENLTPDEKRAVRKLAATLKG